ncbi:MAG TPA: tRNA (adenosine(37)-N6)-dimethylallyltransferase MiaA [Candidatus Butyricicoccus stercorigallinarum]|nr:tRNA (adenosine(37)-N6)-dimethylallyltransferase MiaA [Candidatus Butyricicoccus stercorigallinarum]
MKPKLICIAGPTASGKTALSIALAKQLQTEIISSDSMQLYRGMDIGTAKPDLAERDGVVHHMFDVAQPGERFSVARYQQMADACAQQILARGRIPIVCGGTGLYLDALIEGSTFSGDETDTAAREAYQAIAREQGAHALHEMLRAVDPKSAERIHENNVKRVVRALEVYQQTGMTIDELNARNKRAEPKYDAILFALCPTDRQTLYDRIDRRVDQMVEQGLLEEARRLWEQGALTGTAGQAIGYKELLPYLRGEAPLAQCLETLKRASRNYAKRQLTWLRRDARVRWLYYNSPDEFSAVLRQATEILAGWGVP